MCPQPNSRSPLPLWKVRLSSKQTRLYWILSLVSLVALLVSLVSYFFDWHEVRESNAFEGLGTLFLHGDHSPARLTLGPAFRDSGYDHSGMIVPVLLGALALLLLGAVSLRQFWVSLSSPIWQLLVSAWLFVELPFLAHMFDNQQSLNAEGVFYMCFLVVQIMAITHIAVVMVLFVGARRAAATRIGQQ